MPYRWIWAVVLYALFAAQVPAAAAENDLTTQLRDMQTKLEKLAQRVDDQQKTIEEQKQKIQNQQKILATMSSGVSIANPVDSVLERLGRAETQSSDAIKIASRKKANDLNPSIGAALDTAYRNYQGPNNHAGDRAAANDFSIRGAEVIFSQDVDPYFKTYMVLNAVPDRANNDEAVPSLEEAAIMTTSFKDVTVKGGRFFMPFGRLSMIHDHDLPFTTRPPVLDTYVGGESQGNGVQAQALMPINHFLQLTGGVFNKLGAEFSDSTVGQRRDPAALTFFGKVLTSFEFGDKFTMDWGVSTAQVPDSDNRRSLSDLEFTLHYHPKTTALREKLVWGTELLNNHLSSLKEIPASVPGDPSTFAYRAKTGNGGYTYLEYFIDPHWSVGPRVDMFQNVDPNETVKHNLEQTYTAFVSYKFSEFSRLRFEYNHHDYFDNKKANEFFMQWTVFWGAHSHNFDLR